MRVTVIREGNTLRLIESSIPIADGAELTLYTEDELRSRIVSPTIWEAAQLDSIFREHEENWGDSLDELTLREAPQ